MGIFPDTFGDFGGKFFTKPSVQQIYFDRRARAEPEVEWMGKLTNVIPNVTDIRPYISIKAKNK